MADKLYRAIKLHDVGTVREVIQPGSDLDENIRKTFGIFVWQAEQSRNQGIREVFEEFAELYAQKLLSDIQTAEECSRQSEDQQVLEKESVDEGNQIDLDIKDCLSYLASDSRTKLLIRLLEAGLPPDDITDKEGKCLLHHVAATDAAVCLKILLKYGASPDVEDLQRIRPLMLASRSSSNNAFHILQDATSDISHADHGEQTALHYACKGNNVIAAQCLMEAKIKLQSNIHQETELMVALSHNAEDCARLLVDRGVDINVGTRQNLTALHYAAKYDCPTSTEVLCRARVKHGVKDRHGYTPLAVACKNGHEQVVRVLLAHMPKPLLNSLNKNQNSPIDLASMMGHVGCVEALLAAEVDISIDTSLIFAAQGGHADVMAVLVDNYKRRHGPKWYSGALEYVSKQGMAPLHVSALYSHDACIKLLLQEGANPCQAMVTSNETALMFACGIDAEKCVRELLQAMGREAFGLNQLNSRKKSALHYAATAGAEKCTALLLAAGALKDLRDNHGYTPLLLAVERGHTNVARQLIQARCDVNAQRKEGWNALHLAALNDNVPCGESLLDAGLDPDASSWISRVSPAILAAKRGHQGILRLLLDSGANIEWADCDGMTALHHAAKNDRPDCITLLVQHRAEVNCATSIGLSPLRLAAIQTSVQALRRLVYYNAKLKDVDVLRELCIGSYEFRIMLKLLFEAGCSVGRSPSAGVNVVLEEEDEDGVSMLSWLYSPRSLQVLCRAVVRSCMMSGLYFRNDLCMLPIPTEIQCYVGMDTECALREIKIK